MSRIGKLPIPLPQGVEVKAAADGTLTVKGPKGTLVPPDPPAHERRAARRHAACQAPDRRPGRPCSARPDPLPGQQHGRRRLRGYRRVLEIEGVGYRAAKDGKKLVLSLGFSHQVPVEPLEGIDFEVGQDTNTRRPFITISGIDKESVGQQAAVIRKLKPPEPYKGKGIRYQGEIVRRKAGKSGKAGGKGGGKGGKK